MLEGNYFSMLEPDSSLDVFRWRYSNELDVYLEDKPTRARYIPS